MGHVLMENRNGLAVDAALTRATGTAEREAALVLLDRRPTGQRITLGADKAYDVTAFVNDLRSRQVTPHVAVDVGAEILAESGRRPGRASSGRSVMVRKRSSMS